MFNSSAKKMCAAVMAFATAVTALTNVPVSFASADAAEKYEFEDGVITGTSTSVMTEEKGFSGTGYVYLKDAGDTISVDVEVPSTGMYDITIAYNLPTDSGSKTQNIYINDVNQGQIVFSPNDQFSEKSIGTFKLTEGKNTIKIESSWGWTMFDYLSVKEAVLPELSASSKLSDAQATDSAKRLMSYLADTYGNKIISGQQEFYGVSRDDEFNYIEQISGKLPAIRGFDFGETCPLYAWDAGTSKRMIAWAEKGGIVTASWHVNVPTKMENYTLGSTMAFDQTTYSEKTDFVTANVMVEGTVEHDYFLLAVDNLAKELQKVQDADVPVLFRPFHEAEGNGGVNGEGAWFWWSKEGAETYKELYKYLYSLLTEKYDLHNLIWEFNSYVYDNSYAWYPGSDYVDIVGYDKYNAHNWNTGTTAPNTSAISGIFYSLVDMYGGDKKPIAMMENDTIPSVENLVDEKAGWLYFCPWYGEHLMDTNYNTKESLEAIYKSDYVITLDELPELKTYPISGDKEPDTTTTTTETAETTTEESETTSESVAPPTGVTYKEATVIATSDNTIAVEFEDGENVKIDIPAGFEDVAKDLAAGDYIRVGYHDISDLTKPVEIEKLEVPMTTTEIVNPQLVLKTGTVTEIKKSTIIVEFDDGVTAEIFTPQESYKELLADLKTGDVITATYISTDDLSNPVNIKKVSSFETTVSETTEGTTGSGIGTATLLGDVTCDGEIDVRDVTLLNQYIVKMADLSEEALANADVIADGTVDLKDLGQLKKFLIKVIDKF